MTTAGPWLLAPGDSEGTALVLQQPAAGVAQIAWVGPMSAGLSAADVVSAVGSGEPATSVWRAAGRSVSVLPEVGDLWFARPGLDGYRLNHPVNEVDSGPAGRRPVIGTSWTTRFTHCAVQAQDAALQIRAEDPAAGLELVTDIQAVAGGLIRLRHTLTNKLDSSYVVNSLDITVPVDERCTEFLDLTGRWGRERSPQRRPIADGIWLRESRTGKPGPESVTMLTAGLAGFGFGAGTVWGAHLGWSGNSRQFLQRQPSGVLTLGGGELLLPGELVLARDQSYSTPWLYLGSSEQGLDGLAAQFHQYLRSVPAAPTRPRPVIINVWEAVYFDHDLARLTALADVAADLGVELFVLDDGWFGSRRNDRSGLGDWVVSHAVWPDGLGPLVEHVLSRGMAFGLWFEPEMINVDSDLFRDHPDWILGAPDQPEFRNQLVLDVGRPEVRKHLIGQIDDILSSYPISYVKWDHNRALADATSGGSDGGAGVHAQTEGFYALLAELSRRHPSVEWESCASGGARIDLGVLQQVQRVWTSDMTDAASRQPIQRWTAQLVAAEYLGAHVSAPDNHQTGRMLPLDFRAATAFFGSFGVEWDVTRADAADRARLAEWIAAHKRHRELLHSGRMFRADTATPSTYIHGVVAADRSEAVACYVQLDEEVHDPEPFVIPGLAATSTYHVQEVAPAADSEWRGSGLRLTGAVLGRIGLPAPARRPVSALIVELRKVD